jgi:hypothetical protein
LAPGKLRIHDLRVANPLAFAAPLAGYAAELVHLAEGVVVQLAEEGAEAGHGAAS